jgi:hypothetical protein
MLTAAILPKLGGGYGQKGSQNVQGRSKKAKERKDKD